MAKKIGQVYRYAQEKQEGIIVSRDSRQYEFSAKDSPRDSELSEGNVVEFEADGKKAREVCLLTSPAVLL